MAVGALVRVGTAKGVFVDFPFAVVGYEQVQAAVVIVVEPACRDGPHFMAIEYAARDSGLVRNVGECAVVVVMKKLIPGYVGEEDIRPPIVVVVSDGDSHAVALALHAGPFRHVGERAVTIVVK